MGEMDGWYPDPRRFFVCYMDGLRKGINKYWSRCGWAKDKDNGGPRNSSTNLPSGGSCHKYLCTLVHYEKTQAREDLVWQPSSAKDCG